jgi:hypothetical protein
MIPVLIILFIRIINTLRHIPSSFSSFEFLLALLKSFRSSSSYESKFVKKKSLTNKLVGEMSRYI